MHIFINWLIVAAVIVVWYLIAFRLWSSSNSKIKSEIIRNVLNGIVQEHKSTNKGEKFDNLAMSRNFKLFIKQESYSILMNLKSDYDEEFE